MTSPQLTKMGGFVVPKVTLVLSDAHADLPCFTGYVLYAAFAGSECESLCHEHVIISGCPALGLHQK